MKQNSPFQIKLLIDSSFQIKLLISLRVVTVEKAHFLVRKYLFQLKPHSLEKI